MCCGKEEGKPDFRSEQRGGIYFESIQRLLVCRSSKSHVHTLAGSERQREQHLEGGTGGRGQKSRAGNQGRLMCGFLSGCC